MKSLPRVLCVLGATGTGKTEASLALADLCRGSVINVDSRQVYSGVAVTTAQPTPTESARCPHLLYGFLPLDQAVSAGAYAELAARAVRETVGEGRTPILTGGTGLYFQALLEGLAPIPDVPEPVRAQVLADWDAHGPEAMHARLAKADPAYAARIHANDRQRVTRALEVFLATGQPFTSWHARLEKPLEADCLRLGVCVPKPELDRRLARRIDAMLEAGALEEIRQALALHPGEDTPGLSGIGCAELSAHLKGAISLAEACRLWLSNTRAYAKRQATWFKRDPSIHWYAPGQASAMLARARAWLEEGGQARPGASA